MEQYSNPPPTPAKRHATPLRLLWSLWSLWSLVSNYNAHLTMYPNMLKQQFIELRAQDISLARISEQIGVSKDKELFRIAVLRVLNANHTQYGLGVEAVRHLVAVFGFQQAEHSEAEDAIYYLARRHFIEEIERPLSPENRIWRITSLGTAFLDERT